MKLDLHVHTKYSKDCMLKPEELLKAARIKGLDGIAVADHNTIRGGVEVKKLVKDDFKVIVCSEVKTDRGEVIGYLLNEEVNSRRFEEVVEDIRAQGGIVCIPHPFDFFRFNTFTPNKKDLKFIDCIEVFNSRCRFAKFNEKAGNFARENGLAITAGSDAHTHAEVGLAGVITDTHDLGKMTLKNVNIFGSKTPFSRIIEAWIRKTL